MGKRGFIAYDPVLARESFDADILAAIYYKRLLWYESILPKQEGFFTKSSRDIEVDTCITRRQQERVRKYLEKSNYILTVVKIPIGKTAPQLHFKIIDESRV